MGGAAATGAIPWSAPLHESAKLQQHLAERLEAEVVLGGHGDKTLIQSFADISRSYAKELEAVREQHYSHNGDTDHPMDETMYSTTDLPRVGDHVTAFLEGGDRQGKVLEVQFAPNGGTLALVDFGSSRLCLVLIKSRQGSGVGEEGAGAGVVDTMALTLGETLCFQLDELLSSPISPDSLRLSPDSPAADFASSPTFQGAFHTPTSPDFGATTDFSSPAFTPARATSIPVLSPSASLHSQDKFDASLSLTNGFDSGKTVVRGCYALSGDWNGARTMAPPPKQSVYIVKVGV
ncbi:hypothetical protein B484DRAFT_424167 [Ochromonadaceae sp. CCMP2298]|nr:hypothetical protein B484DRAFT_424167 [Ochromonadaceae sp. CCMP2298]|mmetsp:Transcript_32503/g.71529  ORF Transcript_32503/g.71529 Transcript_32503/m.71529 type:complete len:292 (+) Transcript_32503:344-1219(+)|eukprot:CAMPEP_0173198746 /NCGR_PEP_ID=MMETSP1141-20130122/16852_1 /TAXON_ID=483371 /ORGANISM="non described non described, Strain CCMP2298" /LENGTH=291 /DNA_ID=CAMNT_0014123561 /DNA_START=249 /DNA_END=1124 /DNA_ORIENTATION=-